MIFDNYVATLAPYLIYFFGVLSPGPANLAIAQVALEDGKNKSLIFSLGVITGSAVWGIATFTGLVQIMLYYPFLIKSIGFLGVLYMCWLGYLNINKYFYSTVHDSANIRLKSSSNTRYFVSGLMIHLTNPKAFLVWATVLISGVGDTDINEISPYLILIICMLLGFTVFFGYAVLFSNKKIVAYYKHYSKFIHLIVGSLFFVVALQLFNAIFN